MSFLYNIGQLFVYDPARPMLFNSGFFLFALIVFLIVYGGLTRRKTLLSVWVIAFSLFFYYKSSGWYFFILVLTTVTDWFFALMVARSERRSARRFWLGLAVIPSLGLLAYFKYTYFIADIIGQVLGIDIEVRDYLAQGVNDLFSANFSIESIFLPVGISFYTFQSISYVLDVYWKKLKPTRNILDYAFFLTYFPQLVAGPIVKANHFLPQLERPVTIDRRVAYAGLYLIITGLLKKALIADYIAQYNNLVFANPSGYSGFENLMAVYGFALQIYFDFSGYSDMAIGLGMIMGFDLGVNFNYPYKARNITDFWHRWHISLSSWLRDYVYIPLGGNRKASVVTWGLTLVTGLAVGYWLFSARHESWFSLWILLPVAGVVGLFALYPAFKMKVTTGLNLMLTMLIGGLWHGAQWKFVFWGAMHGLALAFHKLVLKIGGSWKGNTLTRTFSWFVTFHFVLLLWIYFRADSFASASAMISQIATYMDFAYLPPFVEVRYVWIIMMATGFFSHFLSVGFKSRIQDQFIASPYWIKMLILLISIQMVVQFKSADVQPFIYFQF